MSRNESASLRRGIDLLIAVQEADLEGMPHGISMGALARRLEVHRSTVARLSSPLITVGLLRKDGESGNLHIGQGATTLAHAYLSGLDLATVAAPHLHNLAERCTAPAVLGVPRAMHMEYLVVEQWPTATRPVSDVGTRIPLHCTAIGKAVLAAAPPAWVDEVIGQGLHRVTDRTITDPSELRAELARTLKRGFAVDDREFATDIRALAAPVRGPRNVVLGAVGVADLPARMSPVVLREAATHVIEIARAISVDMGAAPPAAPGIQTRPWLPGRATASDPDQVSA